MKLLSLFFIICLMSIVIVTIATSLTSAALFEEEVNNFLTKHETLINSQQRNQPNQKQNQKQNSWFRWSMDWMKSVSGAVEELSDAADELLSVTTVDPVSGQVRHADPISSFVAAFTNIVGGSRQTKAQMMPGMTADEKKREAMHQTRRKQKQASSKSNTYSSSSTGETQMLQENGNEEEAELIAMRNFAKKVNKMSFSSRVRAQQQDLHERLFQQRNSNHEQNSILSGTDRFGNANGKKITKSKSMMNGAIFTTAANDHDINNNNNEQQSASSSPSSSKNNIISDDIEQQQSATSTNRRVALALNSATAPGTSFTVAPELTAARSSFASFCRFGVVAVPFTPDMNFTCFDPDRPSSDSNFTINGSVYDSSAFGIANRSACFPEETFLPKTCVCPFDRILYRFDTDNTFTCFGYSYDCNMSVVIPDSYTKKKQDVLINTLAKGIPLRLPYADSIDRRSSTSSPVAANVNCAPIRADAASTNGGGYSLVRPSEIAPLNSSLITVYFNTQGINDSPQGATAGSYTSLRWTSFQYMNNLTRVNTPDRGNASTIPPPTSAAQADADVFVFTPGNFLITNGLFYLRPHSFIDFSNMAGAAVARVSDELKKSSATGGLFVGGQNVSFSFSPNLLSDDFFTGGQLSVEMGFMTPTATGGVQDSTVYLTGNFPFKNTGLAELITYDVSNAPPPLPKAPPTPLDTSTIVLIAIGVIAVIAGIIAIIVAIIRHRNSKAAKIQRKKERKELMEIYRREQQMKKEE